jgi:hypothetical protein
MKAVNLILSLAVMVPVGSILGGLTTFDSGFPLWWGLTIGALIGVFIGCVIGGNPEWKIWDYIYGPREDDKRDD